MKILNVIKLILSCRVRSFKNKQLKIEKGRKINCIRGEGKEHPGIKYVYETNEVNLTRIINFPVDIM